MRFKNWPYWLKGGLIGIVVVIVGFLINLVGAILFNLFEHSEPIFFSEYPLMYPFLIASLPFAVIFSYLLEPISHLPWLSFFNNPMFLWGYFVLIDSISLFMIGAISGLIFRKGRSKKQKYELTVLFILLCLLLLMVLIRVS